MRPLSDALETMPRSGIRAIFDLAFGIPDMVTLGAGEPNFATPEHIVEAADRAARTGATHYTPNAGIPELREAAAAHVREKHGVDATAATVCITPGGVAALYSALTCLVRPGDEVLLTAPSWPNYRMITQMNRAVPVYVPVRASTGFVPAVEDLERAVTEHTRVIVLNFPGNPTGAVASSAQMREVLDFAHRHDLWVISDEVYDALTYDGPHVAVAPLGGDERTLSVYSFSKTYAMTGWRIGYVTGPQHVLDVVVKAQEGITSCVNAPAQHAALAALTGPQDAVATMRDAYRERRDLVMEALGTAGVPAFRPSGAFYVWVDVSAAPVSDVELARRLVLEHHVAVVPGSAFGPGCAHGVRMSLATDTDQLLEGIRRFVKGLEALRSETPPE